MINRESSTGVLVEEGESGTGHFAIGTDAGGHAFHELRFAGAELADQSDDASPQETGGKLAPDSLRVGWTNGSERSHDVIFDFRLSIFD